MKCAQSDVENIYYALPGVAAEKFRLFTLFLMENEHTHKKKENEEVKLVHNKVLTSCFLWISET